MTDNEIIKALECCKFQTKTHCSECPIFPWSDCHAMVVRNALDLINRQKAEIIELAGKYEAETLKLAMENDKLKIRIIRLRQYDEERDIRLHARLTEKARAEAIKDFAERLKEKAYYCEKKDGKDNFVVDEMDIDNIVKEMVGKD